MSVEHATDFTSVRNHHERGERARRLAEADAQAGGGVRDPCASGRHG